MEESNLYLKIDSLKGKFDHVHSFYHKYAIEALIKVLEDYLCIPDISFKKHLDEQLVYAKMKNIRNIRFHDSFYNFINNNYKLVSNMIIPYAIEDRKQLRAYQDTYIDPNTCLKIISDFLMKVDPELYNMFCYLYNSKHILFENNYIGGCELLEKKRNSIYIIVGPLSGVNDMQNLVHELGHAYKDFCFQECHKYFDINDVLASEISSETLELMFLDYLIKNNIYYNDAIYSFKYYHERIIEDAKLLATLDRDYYNKSFIYDLAYFIGRTVASNYMINKDMTYPELIRYAYSRDILRLLKELDIDHGKIIEKIREFHK